MGQKHGRLPTEPPAETPSDLRDAEEGMLGEETDHESTMMQPHEVLCAVDTHRRSDEYKHALESAASALADSASSVLEEWLAPGNFCAAQWAVHNGQVERKIILRDTRLSAALVRADAEGVTTNDILKRAKTPIIASAARTWYLSAERVDGGYDFRIRSHGPRCA